MDDFLNQAKEQHEVLEGMMNKMTTLFANTAKYYCFDKKKYTMEEFFGDVKKFLESFKVGIYEFRSLQLSCNPVPCWSTSAMPCTMQWRHDAVNFLQDTQNRHPIARPGGRVIGCLLLVRSLLCVLG